MTRAPAFAKINLGLVVGPLREDGKHEIVTLMQAVELHDDIEVEPASELEVEGFPDDTIVHAALTWLARAAGVEPHWHVRIEKRIPVAAGLGGGSADAATALRLANASLPAPLPPDALDRVAARIGADVPFFLRAGAQLATGDGSDLTAVALPTGYHVVLLVPDGETKESTESVYDAFDARSGADGYEERARDFHTALSSIASARDLAALPANDLVSSPLAVELRAAGAFRADVSGAGPALYGLFERAEDAADAAAWVMSAGRTVVTRPLGTTDVPRVAR